MPRARDEDRGPAPPMLGGMEAAYIPPKRPSLLKAVLRRITGAVIVLLLVTLLFIAGSDIAVRSMAKDRVFDLMEDVPSGRAGLVFGCAPTLAGGAENTYFRGRMEAAAQLYKSGRVSFLIVSGDNRQMDYNEPQAMRRELRERGVPNDRIVSDYAGLRTLDSVVRLKEVFGQHEVVFISQQFQNERAVFLARHHGIDAAAYNAGGEAGGFAYWRNWVRERLARVLMLLDLYILDTGPKHLGPREPVPAVGSP